MLDAIVFRVSIDKFNSDAFDEMKLFSALLSEKFASICAAHRLCHLEQREALSHETITQNFTELEHKCFQIFAMLQHVYVFNIECTEPQLQLFQLTHIWRLDVLV